MCHFQGICLGVGLLGHMVVLFLVFKESPYHLPQWLYQFTFPPTVQEHSLFPKASPAFIVCRLFDDGHSDLCEVISHCSFDLHFSNNGRCRASFHVFISHLYVSFGEMSVYVFCPLFDWIVCFSDIELLNCFLYFLPLKGCLFTLCIV